MLSPTTLLEFNFRWPTMVPGEVLALTLLMVLPYCPNSAPRKTAKNTCANPIKQTLPVCCQQYRNVVSCLPLVLAERHQAKAINTLSARMESSPVVLMLIFDISGTKPVTALIVFGCFTGFITTIHI
jgi:hypothetical protein